MDTTPVLCDLSPVSFTLITILYGIRIRPMYLRRLFSLHNPLQQQIQLHKSIFFARRIQSLAKISENPQTTTTLNLTHDAEWKPSSISYSKLLSQCYQTKSLNPGLQIHTHLIKLRLENDPKHRNHLINLYSKCLAFDCARKLLDESHEPDLVDWSTLISGYAKVGDFEDAKTVFDHIPNPDIVSLNAIIAGCVLHEYYNLCLELFFKMKSSRITPNKFTYSSVLKACLGLGLQDLGKQFHSILIKSEIELDPFLCCGLIDIYSKCGEMDDAQRVYDMMPQKELIALKALLSGHSENGNDIEALTLFTKHMDGIGFDETTLLKIIKSSASLQDVYVSEQIHGLSLKSGFQSDPFVINSLVVSYSKCGHVEIAKMLFDESDTADLASFTSLISA